MTEATQSAGDMAYHRIRQMVTDGSYNSGERLKEEELAERVGASRTPIRHALTRLQNEGLITIIKNRGAFVAEFGSDDAREIFDLRSRLEPYSARLAALRRDHVDLERLEELAANMEALDITDTESVERMTVLNNQFHDVITIASGSTRTHDMMRGLVSATLVMRTFAGYDVVAWQRSLAQHREILDALRSGDGEWAEAVMRTHIAAGAHQYLHTRGGR